jgi:hypothetical protein
MLAAGVTLISAAVRVLVSAHTVDHELPIRLLDALLAHAGGFRDASDTKWEALRFYTEADVDFEFYSMSWPLNVWALHVTQQGARFFGDQGIKSLRETWTAGVANWLVQTAIDRRYTECVPCINAAK